MGDAGLTGRKIIVDTYGGMARHGGGAFSGKDPSKVDRSAAYAMRWVAKNVVAAGLARRCEVQVAYAIGKAQPVGVFIETFGTGTVPDEKIQEAVLEVFDLRPAAIIRDLDLLRPIYAKTAAYGHFGRELPEFTWERTDRAEALKAAVAGLTAHGGRQPPSGPPAGRHLPMTERAAGGRPPPRHARGRQRVAGQGRRHPEAQGRPARDRDRRPGGPGARRPPAGPPRPAVRLPVPGRHGRGRGARLRG